MGRIPDHIRQQVIDWPHDARRGAVDEFCAKHGVSRAWFYRVRKLAAEYGQAAMVKESTRPASSPNRVGAFYAEAVLAQRAQLRSQGKDYGPDSVLFALKRQGFTELPSRSTVVRIFDQHHVVDRNRKKRPKRAHKRFAARFPNQRWQSDAYTETLASGAQVTVIEILDDAARYSLKVAVAASEASDPVVTAFKEAIEAHGRPVLAHTDNSSAFNTERWNRRTELVDFLHDLGIKTITGRPSNPKSQGKVERHHQTLQKFTEAHRHRCHTAGQLQQLLADEYQPWYNYDRANQALGRETTPADVYHTWPKVVPPAEPITPPAAKPANPTVPGQLHPGETALATRTVTNRGAVRYRSRVITVGRRFTGSQIHLIEHTDRLEFYHTDGSHLATLDWPTHKANPTVAKQIPSVY